MRLADAQGGTLDPSRIDFGLPAAPYTAVVTAEEDGIVAGVDPLALGYGVIELGGGRTRQDQEVDPRVGFVLGIDVGERVARGDRLAVVHASTRDGLAIGARAVREAVVLSDDAPTPLPLILERLAN